jgi:hypothetical protein
MTKIRLCKGQAIGRRSWAFGVKNKAWGGENLDNEEGWYRVNFPETKLFIDIADGSIEGLQVLYKENFEPVPAKEIVKHIFLQNKETRTVSASGYHISRHYGQLNKWYVDYSSEIHDLFEELGMEIPEDRKSISDRMREVAMGNLQAMGFAENLNQGYDVSAPGLKALEDAKQKAREEALAEKEAEIEALKAQLEAQNAPKKKKETASLA